MATTDTITVPLSAAMIANAQGEGVWLDGEAQAEFGTVTVAGSRIVGTREALEFMADNAEDYAQELNLQGSRLGSFVAIATRIRFAIANPGVRYSAQLAHA